MAVESEERIAGAALAAFADAARAVAGAETLRDAAGAIVEAVGRAVPADAVVGRVADERGDCLPAYAVFASSSALAAQLEGSRVAADELPARETDDVALLPAAVRRAAERATLDAVVLIPVRVTDGPLTSLELLRAHEPFGDNERELARLAAYQLAAAARSFVRRQIRPAGDGSLALAGEALAAASEAVRTPEHVARLAADATGASMALLWRLAEAQPELIAAHGVDASTELVAAAEAAARALGEHAPFTLEEGEFPDGAGASVTLQLGQPVLGALQLLFPAEQIPAESELERLVTFGVRAANVLRTSADVRELELELERTRTLVAVVGQATAQLSLSHTLKTVAEKTAELLGTDRLAVYLLVEDGLLPAIGHGVSGPHLTVAQRLLDLLQGPYRARTVLTIEDVLIEPHLAPVADDAAEAEIDAVIAVPLLVHDRHVGLVAIGLLAVYPPRGRAVTDNESALLTALAGQLAVAVQNAQLHEQAKRQEQELKAVLESERQKARELRAVSAISQSFTEEEMSLDRTVQAVARTVVDVLGVDAAVVHVPDERGELLVPHPPEVGDERFADAAETILYREQAGRGRLLQRLLSEGGPILLDAATVGDLSSEYGLLAPFLEKGWTGAVVPIPPRPRPERGARGGPRRMPTEILAVLGFFSMQPERPITTATLESAEEIARHAAVAIDRARLYQQQREFADTMQRSLLPRVRPDVPGLELGAAYDASAKVEVGGDVYDFLVLADGRLAVVLGDVTGHGIDATADMAMAKFVFRSLAREHTEPADFLAAANDVVFGEIAAGKFITMLYLAVDGATGSFACAGAGHPPPRLVAADGSVRPLDARGLVLGVAEHQRYDEVHGVLTAGGAVVLYTDGVVEARRAGTLFGTERLDALLAKRRDLTAQELAKAVLAECRAFAGGALADDCAVVVVRRTPTGH